MVGILFAILAVAYLLLSPPQEGRSETLSLLVATTLTLGGSLILLQGLAWWALQSAELKATPRILELYWNRNRWSMGTLFLLGIGAMATPLFPILWITAIWIVLAGLIVDTLYKTISRVFTHLTPPAVLPLYSAAARSAIQQEKPGELCQWIDASVEAGMQSLEGRRPTFCLQLFDELQGITKTFLQANKSIGHQTPTDSGGAPGQQGDTVLYILLFILQRMELLGQRSVEQQLEPVNTALVTTLGKITVEAARYDISLAQYPLHYLGRSTRLANEHDMREVTIKASYTLVAVVHQVTEQIDLSYLEIADFFIGIVGQLEENARVLLQSDKRINLEVLQQPFLDIRTLFAEKGKLSQHRDAGAILQALDAALAQFKALEEVMGSGAMATGEAPQRRSSLGVGIPDTPVDDEGLSAKIVQELEERLGGGDTLSGPLSDER